MKGIKKLTGNIDMLHGPIFKTLIIFALPMLISTIFQHLYNLVDIAIVGHLLGDRALTAIGSSSPIYDIVISLSFGLGGGLSIVTARCFGQGEMEKLKKSIASCIIIGIVFSIVATISIQFAIDPLMEAINTPKNLINEAKSYIVTITMCIGISFAYNLCSGILRAIGNSFMPLVFLIISTVLNVILDYIFISNFNMGIRGAAVATVIAQFVSVILCLIYIATKAKMLIPQKRHFVPNKSMYTDLLGQGFSMALMNCVVSIGTLILQSGINNLSADIIAAHTTARKLFSFTVMLINVVGMAGNTFISQNRGANRPDRIRKCLKCQYIYYAVATVILCSLLQFVSPLLIKLVSGSSSEVLITNGAHYLQYTSPFYFILGLVAGTRTALQAIGQKILPIISSIIEFIGKVLFVIYLIPKHGYIAVIFCEPIIWCAMAIQLLWSFWRNPYIRKQSI